MKKNLNYCNEYRVKGLIRSSRFSVWSLSFLLFILPICIGCKNADVPFATNTYTFKKISPTDNFDVEAEINVDFPISGNTELKKNIIDFVLEALTEKYVFEKGNNPQYKGDTSDGQSIVDHFGNEKIKELQEMGIGNAHIFINKVLENEKFISYLVDYFGDAGGVGIGTKYGATFDKNSGERLQLIKNPNDGQFKDYLIKRVEDVIVSQNQESLLEKTQLASHPFPEYPPFLTKDGVCFIYQKYEIGAGALGEVEVTILVEDIAEYLSDLFVNSNDGEDGSKAKIVDNSEQEVQAKKAFLEKFYNEKGSKGNEYESYIKKNITANCLKILKEKYDYDCDGECLATWLFDYEAGTDMGNLKSQTITPQGTDKFLVEKNYQYGKYVVLLTVIKEGDSYKIDYIENESSDIDNTETDDDLSKYVGKWRLDRITDEGQKMRMEVTLKADKSGEFAVFHLKGNSDDVLVYEEYQQCILEDGVIYLTKNGEITRGKTPQLKVGSDGLYSADNQKYVRVSE